MLIVEIKGFPLWTKEIAVMKSNSHQTSRVHNLLPLEIQMGALWISWLLKSVTPFVYHVFFLPFPISNHCKNWLESWQGFHSWRFTFFLEQNPTVEQHLGLKAWKPFSLTLDLEGEWLQSDFWPLPSFHHLAKQTPSHYPIFPICKHSTPSIQKACFK